MHTLLFTLIALFRVSAAELRSAVDDSTHESTDELSGVLAEECLAVEESTGDKSASGSRRLETYRITFQKAHEDKSSYEHEVEGYYEGDPNDGWFIKVGSDVNPLTKVRLAGAIKEAHRLTFLSSQGSFWTINSGTSIDYTITSTWYVSGLDNSLKPFEVEWYDCTDVCDCNTFDEDFENFGSCRTNLLIRDWTGLAWDSPDDTNVKVTGSPIDFDGNYLGRSAELSFEIHDAKGDVSSVLYYDQFQVKEDYAHMKWDEIAEQRKRAYEEGLRNGCWVFLNSRGNTAHSQPVPSSLEHLDWNTLIWHEGGVGCDGGTKATLQPTLKFQRT